MNTDYHHGDYPIGFFWCDGQIQTGDHEHPLRGRIRSWDGLIILRRLEVSTLLLISHPIFCFPWADLFSSPRLLFHFLVDRVHGFRDLFFSILISRHLTDAFRLHVILLATTPFSLITLRSTYSALPHLVPPHLVARSATGDPHPAEFSR